MPGFSLLIKQKEENISFHNPDSKNNNAPKTGTFILVSLRAFNGYVSCTDMASSLFLDQS